MPSMTTKLRRLLAEDGALLALGAFGPMPVVWKRLCAAAPPITQQEPT